MVKVELSDGSSFFFNAGYLPDSWEDPASWETGRELTPSEEEILRFAARCYRAERTALRLIARAEQNSLALSAKLGRRGYEPAIVRAVISRFMDQDLLNDERYAELWLRSRLARSGKAPSPRHLAVSLGNRGINWESSGKALRKVLDTETEYALLLRYLKKNKFSGLPQGFSLRTRLKYEGFSSAILNQYFDN
jgi:regulatory protein